MKTNKQLTPKELTIYVYPEGDNLCFPIYGRFKNKTYGIDSPNKELGIKAVFQSLYALKEWGIDSSKQTMTAKVIGERKFPKEITYPVVYIKL